VQAEDDGVRIGGVNTLDGLIDAAPQADHAFGWEDDLVPARLDIRRRQLAAIMEFHPLLEGEGIGQTVVGVRPRLVASYHGAHEQGRVRTHVLTKGLFEVLDLIRLDVSREAHHRRCREAFVALRIVAPQQACPCDPRELLLQDCLQTLVKC
jgi:hypothetical protein